MAGLKNITFKVLVAWHARVGAAVKALKVAHPGGKAIGMFVIGPRVRTEPRFSRPVAVVATHTGSRQSIGREQILWQCCQRRVAVGATLAFHRIDSKCGRNNLRAAVQKCGVSPAVKIPLRPSQILVAVGVGAAVAARGCTGLRAKKAYSVVVVTTVSRRRAQASTGQAEKQQSGNGFTWHDGLC